MIDGLEVQCFHSTAAAGVCATTGRVHGADGALWDRELTAVTILVELGDCTRFSSSRQAVRYAGLDITVHQSDQRRAPGHLSRQGPPALRWALYEAAQVARGARSAPTASTTSRRRSGSAVTARPVGRAQAAQAQLPHAARTRRGGAAPHDLSVRASPSSHRCAVAGSDPPAAAPAWTAQKAERPQRFPERDHPITHHVAGPGANPRVADRSNAGRPRDHTRTTDRAPPPANRSSTPKPRTPRWTRDPCTSKEGRGDDPQSRRAAYATSIEIARAYRRERAIPTAAMHLSHAVVAPIASRTERVAGRLQPQRPIRPDLRQSTRAAHLSSAFRLVWPAAATDQVQTR